ncbi:hypothetical protein DITRI_Ditri08aG0050000 [Diplodiscus trichospermus]
MDGLIHVKFCRPTFYQIYKKKTSEGFQSIPYVISLFSAMIWIYYAFVKQNAMLLITINSFWCCIEIFYIATYFYYAPKKERVDTVKLFLLVNVFGFGVIFLSTFFLQNPFIRLRILGYVCLTFALSVFVAPLGIVRKVIKTKSVEYMPFTLSVFLTLSAVMWFFYGLALKDVNIAVPNVLGFIFGILQMIIYAIYKNYPSDDKMVEMPKVHQPNTNNNNGGVFEAQNIKGNTTNCDAYNKV